MARGDSKCAKYNAKMAEKALTERISIYIHVPNNNTNNTKNSTKTHNIGTILRLKRKTRCDTITMLKAVSSVERRDESTIDLMVLLLLQGAQNRTPPAQKRAVIFVTYQGGICT